MYIKSKHKNPPPKNKFASKCKTDVQMYVESLHVLLFIFKFEPLEKRGVLSGDAAAFLKAHNDKRRIVSPTATDMKEMVRK